MQTKPAAKARTISGGELAALYGVHHDTALRWIKEGLPATKKGVAFAIDLAVAVRWVRAQDAAQAREAMAAVRRGAAPLEASRAKKLAAEARIAEVNAQEREGTLVPAAEVQRQWEEKVLAARERLLSLPAKALQLGLVGVDGETALEELVDETLTELAARGEDVHHRAA